MQGAWIMLCIPECFRYDFSLCINACTCRLKGGDLSGGNGPASGAFHLGVQVSVP